MNHRVFLNGDFIPEQQALIPVMDRGFLFADGVYEVIPAYRGKLFGVLPHLERLQRSLDALKLTNPYSQSRWQSIFRELLPAQEDAMIYLQITRGAPQERQHHWQGQTMEQTVLVKSSTMVSPQQPKANQGAILVEDQRWQRCDIKSISLLPNILARQQAAEQNAVEAIMHRDQQITEGSASNLFMVSDGEIITPEVSSHILAGVTRKIVLRLLEREGIPYREARVDQQQLMQADELFITSSTKEICPITRLNAQPVGDGEVGRLTQQVFLGYKQLIHQLVTGSINEYEI
ncbi:aminotransferase class IV [Dongshaea marina]|uniref:aminotransferase class IV n=1 Tax=Dongshaea marina TaxID=2047966 RepID=UPI000D3E1B4B|nr:aminotransferase class IV [Dongshaea marina]